jgi:gliding motility-associated-like protein
MKYTIASIFILLIFSSTLAAQQLCDYDYKKAITVYSSQVEGTTNHTNFPVLVEVTDAELRGAPAGGMRHANGYDIAFALSNGTILTHQIHSYNSSTGYLRVWVNVPVLYANTNTTFYLHYGNTNITANSSSNATWSNGYVGAWSFDAANPFVDHTGNGTLNNNGTTSSNTAIVGESRQFQNNNSQYLAAPGHNGSYDLTNNVTFSGWLRLTNTGLDQKIGGNQDNTNGGFKMGVYTNNKLEFEIRQSNNNSILTRNEPGGTELTTGVWYHVAGVYSDDANSMITYINGVQDRSMTTNSSLGTSSGAMTFGREPFSSSYFLSGRLDEMRLSNVVRSASWLRTEYNNQLSPAGFAAVGPAVPAGVKITTQPVASQLVCEGGSVTLRVAAVSEAGATITYQWRHNNNPIAGATLDSLTLSSITTAQTGIYDVWVIADCDTLTSTPSTLVVMATPTLIINAPTAVCAPSTIDLTASWITAGSAAGALSYWTDAAGTVALTNPSAIAASGTYYIKLTNVAGCSTIAPVALTVNEAPTLVVTNPAAVCSPSTVDLTAAAVTAGSAAGTLSYWTDATATTALTNASAVSVSSTYYIRLTDANNCSAIEPVVVMIGAIPNLLITNPAAVCSPSTVDLTAAAVTAGSDAGTLSYWTDATATTALTNASAVAASGTYYIQLTSADNCSVIEPVVVTINALPTLTITNPAAVCSPSTVDLTASSVTAGSSAGTLSYWTDATATTALTNASAVDASGTYYIQLTSADNCSVIEAVVVTINDLPSLMITPPAAVCSPSTIDLTDPDITDGTVSTGTFSYWEDVDATIPVTNPAAVSVTGVYYIMLTTPEGCSDILPVGARINDLPTLTITNPSAACSPSTVDLTAAAVTAGSDAGTLSYWTDAAGTVSLTDPTSVSSGTYYIRLTSADHCASIGAVVVTVNDAPTLAVTDPAAVCSPSTVDLTAAAVTAGSDAGTLSYWTDATATTALTNASAVAASGTYYIQLTDADNCSSIEPVVATINDLPTLTITNPAAVCSPSTVDLTAAAITAGSAAGTLSYWTDATATTALTNASAVDVSGTYYIQLTSADNCSVIEAVVVTINDLPSLMITPPAAVCSPSTIDLTDPDITDGTVSTGTFSYWEDVDATIPVTNPAAVSVTGVYYIMLTTPEGCSDILPVGARINDLPTLTITNPSAACSPSTVDLTAAAVTAGSDAGTLSYWTDAAGTVSLTDPTSVSSGTYYIRLTSADHCASIGSVVVTVNDAPTLAVTDPDAVCSPSTIDLTAAAVTAGSDAGTLGYWTDATATTALTNASAVAASGTYYIQLTDANNCSSIEPVVATINDLPTLTITNPAAVCSPSTVDLTAAAVTAGSDAGTLSYWTDATATTALTNASAIDVSGTYYIQLTSADNCSVIGSVEATINDLVTPTVALSASDNSFCAGTATVLFTATTTNEGSTPTYEWYLNGVVVGANQDTYSNASLNDGDEVWVLLTSSAECPAPVSVSSDTIAMVILERPVITVEPIDVEACEGQPATFTVTATGTALTYQWRKDGVALTGETSNTFTIAAIALTDVAAYDVVVGGTCTPEAVSAAAQLTVNTPPAIVTNPADAAVCENTTATFTVSASGAGLTYQWFENGTTPVGTDAPSYSFTVAVADSGKTYTVEVSGTCGSSVVSVPVELTVLSNPVITVQPVSLDICENATATFTVNATGAGLTYQWFENGTIPVGTDAPSYSFTALAADNGKTYSVEVSGTCGTTLTSVLADLVVRPAVVPSAVISVDNNPVCTGTSVTFDAVVQHEGTTPVYTWKVNGTTVATGTTQFVSSTLQNNDQVELEMTSTEVCAVPSTVTSNIIVMNVTNELIPSVVITASTSDLICIGTTVEFTATPSGVGATPDYQWKLNGVDVGVFGQNTYTNNTLQDGDQIEVVLLSNDACATQPSVTSNIITMGVTGALVPSVAIHTPTNQVCETVPVTFTATAQNVGVSPTYKWYLNGTEVSGETSATYTVASLQTGDEVTAELLSNDACASPATALSNIITMTVEPAIIPSVTIVESANDVCAGVELTFTATPVNEGTSPEYLWKVNGVAVGVTTSTYTTNGLSNGDVVSVELISSETCAVPDTVSSNAVTLVINSFVEPTVFVSASAAAVCPGTTLVFTANTTHEGTTPSYQWKLNGVDVGTDAPTFSDDTLRDGDIVSVVLVSSELCLLSPSVQSDDYIVNIVSTLDPEVTITSDVSSICPGSIVTFTATPAGVGVAPDYQWTVNGNPVGTNNATFATNTLVDGDVIEVEITSNDVCASVPTATSNTITIEVVSGFTPAVSIATDSLTTCTGLNVTFTATATGVGYAPSYQWKLDGANVGTDSPVLVLSTIGDGQEVSVEITSNDDCALVPTATSNTLIMVVRNAPPLVLTKRDECGIFTGNGYINFEATTNTYKFDFSEGIEYTGPVPPSISTTLIGTNTVPGLIAGTYTVRLHDPATGCYTDETITIDNNVLPQAYNVIGGGNLCQGDTNKVQIGVQFSEPGIQYQLILDGTTLVGPPIPGGTEDIYFPGQTTPGTYTVVAYSLSDATCRTTMLGSAIIGINPRPSIVDVKDTCIAGAGSGKLLVDATISLGTLEYSLDGLNYQASPEFSNLANGTYKVYVREVVTHCLDTLSGVVVFCNEAPIVLPEFACTLTNTALSGDILFNVSDPDGDVVKVIPQVGFITSKGATFDIDTLGRFTYTPAASFKGFDTITYVVCDSVLVPLCTQGRLVIKTGDGLIYANGEQAETLVNTDYVSGQSVLLNDSTDDGDIFYLKNQINTNLATQQSGVLRFNADGSYIYQPAYNFEGTDVFYYTIVDRCGNEASAAITIKVSPEVIKTIFIPEGFSPNGDGQHDYFVLGDIEGLHIEIQVFNRWGSLVYENNDYTGPEWWDGTSNTGMTIGDRLPDGTYYYVITTSAGDKFVNYITLKR